MWIYLTFLATILWAIATIIDERTIDTYIKNPFVNSLFYSLIGLIVGVSFFIYRGPYPISTTNFIIAIFSGVTYVITIGAYFFALKEDEVTRVVPLTSLSSIFTIILAAVLLGEIFQTITYLGSLIIIAGSLLIAYKPYEKKIKGGIKLSKAFLLMTIGGLFSGISAVSQKYLINIGIPTDVVFGYSRIGVAIPSILFILLAKKEIQRLVNQKKHHVFKNMILSETITILGTIFIFLAMKTGPVGLISVIANTEAMFTFIIASTLGFIIPGFLVQKIDWQTLFQKVIATIIIIIGITLIGE